MVDNFYGESGFQIVKNAPFLYRCDRTFTPEVDSCLQAQIEEFEEKRPHIHAQTPEHFVADMVKRRCFARFEVA